MKNIVYALIFLISLSACTKNTPVTIPNPTTNLSAQIGTTLDLGEIGHKKSKLFTVKLENSSETDLEGPAQFTPESPFSLMSAYNCTRLKAKGSCLVKIYFNGSQSSAGNITEVLSINSQTLTLTLKVLPPPAEALNFAMADEVNFGVVPVKNSIIKTLVIKNIGSQSATSQATLDLLAGSIVYDACSGKTIKPKSSCTIKIAVNLKKANLAEGTPIIGTLNFGGKTVNLIGNGVTSGEVVDEEEVAVKLIEGNSIKVSIGMVNPPFTLFKSLTFTNDGSETTTPLVASFTPGSGIFLLANNCAGISLPPQGSCLVKVAMPSSLGYGTKTATLNMGDYVIDLEGSVIAAVISFPPTPVTSQSVPGLPPNTIIVNLPQGCALGGTTITCGQPTVIPPPKLACASQHIYQNGQCILIGQGEGGNNCPSGQYFDGNICVAVVYEARQFSPYAPTPQVCGGIVHQSRSILSCFRVDTDQQVQNSFCVDSESQKDTPSPAGSLPDLAIVGGVQHRYCALGESEIQITGVDCVAGYLRQGDVCIPYNLQVPSTKGFNGTVAAIVHLSSGDVVYGGSFDTFTDNNGTVYSLKGLAKFNGAGQINQEFINNIGSNITGGAVAMVVDANDNIYGATNGGSLWKISSSGVINATFRTNTNNKISGVKALALDPNGNLFIGGSFTAFGSQANNARGLAKLSVDGVFNQAFSDNMDVVPGTKSVATSGITGSLSNSLSVNTLALDSAGNLYAGGSFYSYNGVNFNANKILKISNAGVFDQSFSNNLDVVSGTKSSSSGFYNSDNAPVNKIIVDGNNLYIGGGFSHFKGVSFRALRIAKISTSGIFDQAFSDNLDVTPGSKTTSSGFNQPVRDLFLDGGSLYIVGEFSQFKNTPNNANKIAKLSTNGVFDQTFSDSMDGIAGIKGNGSGFNSTTNTISIKNSQVFVGGGFDSFKNNSAKYTAKFSTSGVFIPYIASSSLFNAAVSDIKQDLNGNTYFVGSFTYFNGKYSPYILKLNSNFEVDESFMQTIGTGFGAATTTLVIDTLGNLYIGGGFTTFNNINNVNRIVKLSAGGILDATFMNNLDVTSGVKASTSGFNSSVYAIKIGTDANLYIAGAFLRVKNNPSAKYLVKLSTDGVLASDFLTGYGSGLNNNIFGLGLDEDNNVYVTGTFTSYGGVANNANGLAKFSSNGVFDQAFSNNLDVVSGTKAATSGFTVSPGTNQGQGILVEGDMLFVVGSLPKFKNVNLLSRGIVKFDLNGNLDQAFRDALGNGLGTSATILSIDTDGESLYVGGSFSAWNGVPYTARNLAKFSFEGELDQDFMNRLNADYEDAAHPGTATVNSGFGSTVQTVSVGIHGELLIGGQFQEFKQLKYERAVILNADGTMPLR
jgi:hypothetical protein